MLLLLLTITITIAITILVMIVIMAYVMLLSAIVRPQKAQKIVPELKQKWLMKDDRATTELLAGDTTDSAEP